VDLAVGASEHSSRVPPQSPQLPCRHAEEKQVERQQNH